MKPFAKSKSGKVHTENEDHYAAVAWPTSTILAVADGIGSHAFGGSVAKWFCQQLSDSRLPCKEFESTVRDLHQQLKEEFSDFPDFLDSGASIACACVAEGVAHFLWAGDSPIYLVPFGTMNPTLVSSPHAGPNGALTEYFMGNHPFSPSTTSQDLATGDLIVISSDGIDLSDSDLIHLCENSDLEHSIESFVDSSVQSEESDDSTLVAYRHGNES